MDHSWFTDKLAVQHLLDSMKRMKFFCSRGMLSAEITNEMIDRWFEHKLAERGRMKMIADILSDLDRFGSR